MKPAIDRLCTHVVAAKVLKLCRFRLLSQRLLLLLQSQLAIQLLLGLPANAQRIFGQEARSNQQAASH